MAMPRAALILGLAGLLPFVWGALTEVSAPLADWGATTLGPRFVGPYVGLAYGTVILAFMSGVLWGFATQARGTAATQGYVLSVVPALWAFFMVGGGPVSSAINLMAGFAGVLLIDWSFWRQGMAPAWWMTLRSGLTAVALACLSVTAFG